MFQYHGMICLAANQVWWTWECEDTFIRMKKRHQKAALKDCSKKHHRQIDDLVMQVSNKVVFETDAA